MKADWREDESRYNYLNHEMLSNGKTIMNTY